MSEEGLGFLDWIADGIGLVVQVQCAALTWAHGNIPRDTCFGIRTFLNPLIANIAPGPCVFAVQQGVCLGHVA